MLVLKTLNLLQIIHSLSTQSGTQSLIHNRNKRFYEPIIQAMNLF